MQGSKLMSEEEIENYITETIPLLKKNFDTQEDLNWAIDYIRKTLRRKQ